jgi:hypothetical protein
MTKVLRLVCLLIAVSPLHFYSNAQNLAINNNGSETANTHFLGESTGVASGGLVNAAAAGSKAFIAVTVTVNNVTTGSIAAQRGVQFNVAVIP